MTLVTKPKAKASNSWGAWGHAGDDVFLDVSHQENAQKDFKARTNKKGLWGTRLELNHQGSPIHLEGEAWLDWKCKLLMIC